jgi:hypothetical protein
VEECRPRVFENRVLRRIFGPKGDEVTESGKDYVMRSLKVSSPQQLIFKRPNYEE